jgi:ankyrin repeat protein
MKFTMKMVSCLVLAVLVMPVQVTYAAEAELIRLAKARDGTAIQHLISTQKINLETKSGTGDAAVLIAARSGDLKLFDMLVNLGANINALDANVRDVLNIAVSNKNVELAKRALSAGINPTMVTSQYQGSALIYASAQGAVEIVDLLIRAGAPLDRINNIGWTALLEAVILGDGGPKYLAITDLLLKAGADKSIADRDGKTPYDLAVEKNQTALAARLSR